MQKHGYTTTFFPSMGVWHQLVFLGRALVFFNIIKKVVNVFSHESYHWLINNEHITRLIGLETPYNWLVFVVVQRSCAASRAGSFLFLWTLASPGTALQLAWCPSNNLPHTGTHCAWAGWHRLAPHNAFWGWIQ